MSINGLYDSERGDKLARKSMQCFKKPEPDAHERFCSCGALLPAKPKYRYGKQVCDGCAVLISKKIRDKQKERVIEYKTVCSKCGGHFPYYEIITRNKKKYCKTCGAKENTTWAYTFRCHKCGEIKPRRGMVRRNGEYYCHECGDKMPKAMMRTHKFCCSVCGQDAPRKKLLQRHGILFCSNCFKTKK